MRITDLLDERSIDLNARPKSKNEALDQAVELMAKSGKVKDKDAYKKLVYAREEESTTGVGEGIAIPHGKGACVSKPGLAAMVINDGVEFQALDDEPVDLLFLIAAPDTKDNVHLDVLSKLSMMLMDEDFRDKLKNAKSPKEFLKVIDEADEERASVDESLKAESTSSGIKIVAVTSCPTGIAHTYMAAEGLEKAAKKAGVVIKVETRGSSGAKNVLSDADIEDADCVIVAADAKVPMGRFKGKKLIQRKVADGINKADELIEMAIAGDASVFNGSSEENEKEDAEKKGGAHNVYTWLMAGVSHMLPLVVGGGILVALAFLVDTIAGYGASGSGNFGSITPLAALLKYVGGLAMGLMVPVLAGYIAYAIADRPGLAVGFVGGLLAANGNAALSGFVFSDGATISLDGKALGAFSKFLADLGFQHDGGGATVSGFLGGIVAGFLAGFIVLGLQKLCSKMPAALDGIKPMLIYPLVGMFCIAVLMIFIFNPLIGWFNTELSEMLTQLGKSNALWALGLVLGAMMAIDMGGPINKAAYVFGSGMLAQAAGSSDPNFQKIAYISMAAVMVGGMCPPVGIALANLIFPKKFTKAERGTTITNFIMGASFITEGAIPFAAADPGRVIPCTLVGSGVAGLLVAVFECTLMAPHGGLFVVATIGNPLLYLVAWAVGSVITAVMLGVLKKNVEE